MSKHLVIGTGQIGKAILAVLECHGYDVADGAYPYTEPFDCIHICFGHSDAFEEDVKHYQEITGAKFTVIHSTVPVGTSSKLGAVHSPVRGKHPNLESSVRTFVKFFGGAAAEDAAAIFREKGIKCVTTPKSETTEALKLFDTEQYHLNILAEKAIHQYCTEHDLDFDIVYKQANQTYNEGYEAMGMPQFKKYVLEHVEGPIGGHCVTQNAKLLSLLDLINEEA